jgi:imidazolonepropionase-like amidohydrolase
MRNLTAIALTLLLIAPPARAQDNVPKASYTVIKNVKIFDGVNNRLTSGHVLIENNIIKKVGAIKSIPEGTKIIDGGGRTLLPGLINCHVHLALPDAIPNVESKLLFADVVLGSQLMARGYLYDGFTTVRDAGGNVFGIKKCIDRGLLPGPRIYPSGALITQLGGHFDLRNLTQQKTESHM